MLTIADVNHFQTFGYVVLKSFLPPESAQKLRTEITDNLSAAFGSEFGEPTHGLPGLLLPTMSAETPLGMGFVADDTRYWAVAHLLLGAQCAPLASEANCFYRNAGWHSDSGHTTRSVKFMAYLDPLAPGKGALEVLPGSHQQAWQGEIRQYLACTPERRGAPAANAMFGNWQVPGQTLPTEPGDVVAFDGRLLHRSCGGTMRLAWNVQYVAEPPRTMAAERPAVRDLIARSSDTSAYPYDHHRWPVWDHWIKESDRSPARATAIARLKGLGVFDIDGIGVGMPTRRHDDADGTMDWVSGVPHWVAQTQTAPQRDRHPVLTEAGSVR